MSDTKLGMQGLSIPIPLSNPNQNLRFLPYSSTVRLLQESRRTILICETSGVHTSLPLLSGLESHMGAEVDSTARPYADHENCGD